MNNLRIAAATVVLIIGTWTGVHAANPCVVLSAAGQIQRFSNYLEFVIESDVEGSNFAAWNRSIRTAPRTSLFSVTGHVPTVETIIKADRVVFNQGGTLEFQNLDAEFWAIVARTLEFNFRPRGKEASTAPDRSEQVRIIRHASYSVPTPDQASRGGNGRRYSEGDRAQNGRAGRAGDPGGHGASGTAGFTKELPCFVLIASDIVFNGLGSEEPLADRVVFDLKGIPGGRGGQGGAGGNGGRGQAGGNASFVFPRGCVAYAQEGGDGGRGGDGGAGGPGGKGGDGGDLLFIGNPEAGRSLLSAAVYNTPGKPGLGGRPGRGGHGGRGGAPGKRGIRPCGSRQPAGNSGQSGRTPRMTSDRSGPDGAQGRILIVGLDRLEGPRQVKLFDFLSPK